MTRRLFASDLPKGSFDIRKLGTATQMPLPLSPDYGVLAIRLAEGEERQLRKRLGWRLWMRPRKIRELIKLRQLRGFAAAFAISDGLVNKQREDGLHDAALSKSE